MWSLSADVHHLNHGSFGAVPVAVQESQAEWRRRWEANPTGFVYQELNPGLERARDAVAGFVGADRKGVAFVRNASQGVAAVSRSIEPMLSPGDQILTTSHHYNAVNQTLGYSARAHGAEVVEVDIPFPIDSPETVLERVLDGVANKTRLAVIDHITSPTGLVFPVEDIVRELEPDIPVLVDGAHGPGQVPLDLDGLGASWYTGNLHKWVCSPKGAGFLYTRSDRIDQTVPTVVSHAWNTPLVDGASRYLGLFDWTGTDDFTPWLTIPDAIETVGSAEAGGWEAVMKRNRELALAARDVVCNKVGLEPAAPNEMVGSMAGIQLPDYDGPDPGGLLSPLNQELIDDGFESMVMLWRRYPKQVVRLSAHLYNEVYEYELLADRISSLMPRA